MSKDRHIYDYTIQPGSVGSIVPRMVGRDKKVLELGTGPGSITKLLKANDCRVTGLEIDPAAIELVSPYCERVIACDLNSPQWHRQLPDAEKYEAIVATDVLEHLYDPWATLQTARTLLDADGFIVVSLPHIAHCAVVAGLILEHFHYQARGLLDKTHIRFFGLNDMQALFKGAGLKVIDAEFMVKLPEQTEFAGYWRKIAPEARSALSANPHGTVYQVVVKAVDVAAPGRALQLASLPIPPAAPGVYSTGSPVHPALRFALSLISLRTRDTLARTLRRVGFRL